MPGSGIARQSAPCADRAYPGAILVQSAGWGHPCSCGRIGWCQVTQLPYPGGLSKKSAHLCNMARGSESSVSESAAWSPAAHWRIAQRKASGGMSISSRANNCPNTPLPNGPPLRSDGKTQSLSLNFIACHSQSQAWLDNGITRGSRFFFPLGIVHVAASRSISDQRQCLTSPGFAPVNTKNSKANHVATVADDSRTVCRTLGTSL